MCIDANIPLAGMPFCSSVSALFLEIISEVWWKQALPLLLKNKSHYVQNHKKDFFKGKHEQRSF